MGPKQSKVRSYLFDSEPFYVNKKGTAVSTVLNTKTKERVCCKREELSHGELTELDKASLAILTKLSFKHIVTVKEWFVENSNLFIITEYCSHGDLKMFIKTEKETPVKTLETELMRIMMEIVSALNYMHKHDYLHRDVKPENIFLTNTNSVRLGDFGETRIVKGILSNVSTYTGTLAYSSAEVLDNGPLTKKADVFSLGVVFWELLCLQHPFPDIKDVYNGVPLTPFPANRNQELKELFLTMLDSTPTNRPSMDEIMSHQLFFNESLKSAEKIISLLQNDLDILGVFFFKRFGGTTGPVWIDGPRVHNLGEESSGFVLCPSLPPNVHFSVKINGDSPVFECGIIEWETFIQHHTGSFIASINQSGQVKQTEEEDSKIGLSVTNSEINLDIGIQKVGSVSNLSFVADETFTLELPSDSRFAFAFTIAGKNTTFSFTSISSHH
ncbi:putative Mitogen-activated protein kinase kinase kinase 13 [Blattamonas nauphoetae]|uniref:non-specific serine/threonine protein kinase n=1 Tax=Blattamonas nauphoetae TaxID=2049346 RepID=A0ABQ9XWN4_9EUKA|nr:putative Mitogen-activated protein kinase kinase kinase 13 [Blattamonas nauphoetae]